MASNYAALKDWISYKKNINSPINSIVYLSNTSWNHRIIPEMIKKDLDIEKL